MAKRFTDTDKYKKPFLRGLQGAYKLLWDYLYHDCNHAGIWIVDFEIAQIYLGSDMLVNKIDALKFFNKKEKRIIEVSDSKWFIPSFIEFQYGTLNPKNKAHNSVINILEKYKLFKNGKVKIKGLGSPLDDAKDKDKDKDKELVKEIIRFFNKTCGTNYKEDSKTIQEPIGARLKDGYTLENCKSVIVKKYNEWKNDKEKAQYITPNTLFRPTKFPKYLNQIEAKAKNNQTTQPDRQPEPNENEFQSPKNYDERIPI